MARITSKQAQGMMDAYANVYANKEEPVQEIVEETIQEDKEQLNELGGLGTGGLMRMKQKTQQQQPTPNRRNMGGPPAGGTPVNKLFGGGYNDGSPPQYTGGPNAAQRAAASVQKQPGQAGQAGARSAATGQAPSGGARAIGQKIGGAIGGGIDRGINRAKGGLRAIGNLAGRAVGAVKQGVQSGVNTVKRVAGGTADAVTGNMTDFDKRGGKPQGISRAVAGGVDKLTGDRTDLDKRGVSRLNAGQRAQQQAGNAQAAGAPRLSGAQRAQKMAKDRIAAGKNTVTGKPKSAKSNTGGYNSGPSWTWDSYDPTQDDLFDPTSEFLISEGYAQDIKEAISIMSEPEFMEAFTEGYQQVLNEEV